MDINELTLRQIKEIQSLSLGDTKKESKLYDCAIGKYVIIRSRNEGLNAGYLEAADDTGCVLSKARRVWYHKPADKSRHGMRV